MAVFAQHGWGLAVHRHELAQSPRCAWHVAVARGLEKTDTRIVEQHLGLLLVDHVERIGAGSPVFANAYEAVHHCVDHESRTFPSW